MKQVDFKAVDVSGSEEKFDGMDATIDMDNLGLLFDIVSKQMYRHPISSLVREITSNCFDSHVEAGSDEAVVINVDEDDGGDFISFNDYGVGISPQRMKDVYKVYFKSTKRDTNGQIGFFGLGSKSPLAYTDCFYLNTIFEGIKYEYIIYRGEKSPRIELVLEYETEEGNGSEIKVYFQDYGDKQLFMDACRAQLLYFDNVFFNESIGIDNAYEIVEGEHFKYREDCPLSDMHICLGKVMYPIDWVQLKTSPIKVPIALKFDIGDLCVTPERESLRYIKFKINENTWVDTDALILKKIELAKREIEELANEAVQECFDLENYISIMGNAYIEFPLGTRSKLRLNKNVWDGFTFPAPVYVPLEKYGIHIPKNPFLSFISKYGRTYSNSNQMKPQDVTYMGDITMRDLKEDLLVRTSRSILEQYDKVKLRYYQYLAKTQGLTYIWYISKRKHTKYELYSAFRKWLPTSVNRLDYSKFNLTQAFKAYREEVYSVIMKHTISYSEDIDATWLNNYKEEQRLKRSPRQGVGVGSIVVYDYQYTVTTARRQELDLSSLNKFTGFLIYGFKEEESQLEYLSSLFFGDSNKAYNDEKRCRVYQIAQRNEKHLVSFKNAIHVRTFMHNSNKVLNKIATGIKLEREFQLKLNHIFFKGGSYNFDDDFSKLNKEITKLRREVLDFKTKYAVHRMGPLSDLQKDFENEILEVVEKADGLDKELLSKAVQVCNYFQSLELLKWITFSEESLPLIAEFIKLKGGKLNEEWTTVTEEELQLIEDSIKKANYRIELYNTVETSAERSVINRDGSISTLQKTVKHLNQHYQYEKSKNNHV